MILFSVEPCIRMGDLSPVLQNHGGQNHRTCRPWRSYLPAAFAHDNFTATCEQFGPLQCRGPALGSRGLSSACGPERLATPNQAVAVPHLGVSPKGRLRPAREWITVFV